MVDPFPSVLLNGMTSSYCHFAIHIVVDYILQNGVVDKNIFASHAIGFVISRISR